MPPDFISNTDDPIATFEEDLLRRGPFVDRLAGIMKSAPARSSNVFALYGEWGSGKTSVKNLVVKRLNEKPDDPAAPLVVEFNPWAFSSQAELFQSFFSEVAKILGRKNAGDVAVAFSRLGGYLSIGAKAAKSLQVVADLALLPGGGIAGLVADTLERGGEQASAYGDLLKKGEVNSLEDVQSDLRAALAKLPHSILIIIDDIDRLPPEQILQMFQVVRINASLPKINFLLLMDRNSVIKSLVPKGFDAGYLEKIVQFALDLPQVADDDLKSFLRAGLREVAGPQAGRIDWTRWDETYDAPCRKLLDTPRKLRRALHTFRFHLAVFSQDGVPEVDLLDLFGLEALRLYAPALWAEMPEFGRTLFGMGFIAWYIERRNGEEDTMAKRLDATLELAPVEIRQGCREVLYCLFPQLEQGDDDARKVEWLATCRICTDIHFDSYFLLATNAAYPTQKEIESLLKVIGDYPGFLKEARSLMGSYGLARLLTKLESALKDCAEPDAIRNLLATVWRLDEEDSAINPVEGDWNNRDRTESFTADLLAKISDETVRLGAARQALDLANAVYPLYRLTAHDLYVLAKENPQSQDRAFSKDNLIAIQRDCATKVVALRETDRLIYHPNLGALLRFLEAQEGLDKIRAWVVEQSADDTRLLALLTGLFGRQESSGSSRRSKKTVRFYIARTSLKRLFSLDAAFKSRLEKIDLAATNKWQKLAVEEALRQIDYEARGIQEADYGVPVD
jgi:hypothetical protein